WMNAAGDDPVLQREIPERRAGTRLQQRSRRSTRERTKAPIVDARTGHRITDDDRARLQIGELFDAVGVERHTLARTLQRLEVARHQRTMSTNRVQERDCEWDRENRRKYESELASFICRCPGRLRLDTGRNRKMHGARKL